MLFQCENVLADSLHESRFFVPTTLKVDQVACIKVIVFEGTVGGPTLTSFSQIRPAPLTFQKPLQELRRLDGFEG